MSKLSACMAKAKLNADEMEELRQHASEAGDEAQGARRYLASLRDDLESLRTQLASKGFDLSVRSSHKPAPGETFKAKAVREAEERAAAAEATKSAIESERDRAKREAQAHRQTAEAVRQRLQAAADVLQGGEPAIAAKNPPQVIRGPGAQPRTILDTIRSAGGIEPSAETRERGLSKRFPGLVRKGGKSEDYMRERMQEEGYFGYDEDGNPGQGSVPKMWELIDQHRRALDAGNKDALVYHPQDVSEAVEAGLRRSADKGQSEEIRARDDVESIAKEMGAELTPDEVKAVTDLMAERGVDAQDALDLHFGGDAARNIELAHQETSDDPGYDPFALGHDESGPSAGEDGERSAPVERTAEEGGADRGTEPETPQRVPEKEPSRVEPEPETNEQAPAKSGASDSGPGLTDVRGKKGDAPTALGDSGITGQHGQLFYADGARVPNRAYRDMAAKHPEVLDYLREHGHPAVAHWTERGALNIGSGDMEREEPSRGPVGRLTSRIAANLNRIVEEHAPGLLDVARDVRMKLNPMSAGSDVAQATAKDYANAVRQARYDWARLDRMLQQQFTPEQQRRMWEAADEQSVLDQQGKKTKGKGLDRLAPEERDVVKALQDNAKQTFDIARKIGMIEGEGLPSYVPRIVADLATLKPIRNKAGESSSSLDAIGSNLRTTTSQLLNRKHLTVEETEAAAKAKFGEGAGVVRNIRTLAMATAKLQDAIAGRALVNKIKEIGRQTGDNLVSDHIPEGTTHKWFTIDTPALKTWRPRLGGDEFRVLYNNESGRIRKAAMFKTREEADRYVEQHLADDGIRNMRTDEGKGPLTDEKGQPIFEKTPVYVRGDFEGPLRAVLSQREGMVYRALMALKAKTMGVIMYSPLIHNGVEWGRALAAMPGKVASFKIYFEGNAAKNDPETMRQAITAGLVPIGARYGLQDISSILEEPNLAPGRSWTAQILGAIPGLIKPEAGEAVKSAIDKAGDIWHNTLLWDRVADLQMGLYTNFRDNLVKKGADPQTAQRLAAHMANRYAGALPIEAMSAGARKLANLALFSRTFTLGNLGAMKDVMAGVPSDVQAQIRRDAGSVISDAANSYTRRKSATILGIDIGLNYLMNAAFTSGIAVLLGSTSAKDEAFGYLKRLHDLLLRGKESPLELLNPIDDVAALTPQSANEPGKQDRVYVGRAADGSAIYMRLPMGKIGEEFEGWLTRPLEMLKNKTSTLARPLLQTIENDKGFSRKVYDPYDNTPGSSLRAIGNIATNFLSQQFPDQLIDGVKGLITGQGDQRMNAAEALGPLAGVTFSKGAPGGPEMGEYYAGKREHDTKVEMEMPEIRNLIREGKRGEAIQKMTELGIPPATQGNYMRSTLHPRQAPSPQQLSGFRRYATPEQKKRLTEAAQR